MGLSNLGKQLNSRSFDIDGLNFELRRSMKFFYLLEFRVYEDVFNYFHDSAALDGWELDNEDIG